MSRTTKIEFTRPPTAAVRRRQARRRTLHKTGKQTTRVTLPEPSRSLTPAEQKRFGRTNRIRESIGHLGFSTTDLIREMRDGGLFMPDPPAKPGKRPAVPRRLEIPEPTRKPDSGQRALMKRMERIRESFGRPCRPIAELIREMREGETDLRD
ncbi:MAG: hypothetical protein PHU85_02985 [Phycisphaerae bacterium]|nr:hypothetical protein [Phycisphaerae bacterium]